MIRADCREQLNDAELSDPVPFRPCAFQTATIDARHVDKGLHARRETNRTVGRGAGSEAKTLMKHEKASKLSLRMIARRFKRARGEELYRPGRPGATSDARRRRARVLDHALRCLKFVDKIASSGVRHQQTRPERAHRRTPSHCLTTATQSSHRCSAPSAPAPPGRARNGAPHHASAALPLHRQPRTSNRRNAASRPRPRRCSTSCRTRYTRSARSSCGNSCRTRATL